MSEKIKLLLAEDEPSLGLILKESLETRNFEVQLCENGEIAYATFQKKRFDILVLDIMMPKKDGLTLAQEIRKEDKLIPIIFLTAKSQTQDVVTGFHSGGNDYVKKPFSMEELIVRIHALLERKKQQKELVQKQIGKFYFDTQKQNLILNNKIIRLTHRESSLLELLILNKNEVIERSVILKSLWGKDDFFNGRSMDVFITKLRNKLKPDESIKIINVRGQGYKITY